MFRNKIYVCIIAVTLHFYTFSQHKKGIQNLVDKVENATEKIDKLYLLDSLSIAVGRMRSANFDFYKKNYAKYNREYIELAKELDSFGLAAFKTAKFKEYYLRVVGKPDSARIIVNTMLKDSNRIKNKINLGHLYYSRAEINFQTADLEKVIVDCNKAASIYHKAKDSIFEAHVIKLCGDANQRLGNLTKAIIQYQKADKLYTKLKDVSFAAFNKMSVSRVFSELYLLEEAFGEREEVKKMFANKKNKDYWVLSELSVMDYRDFVKQKEFDKAETALLKALALSKKETRSYVYTFVQAYLSIFYSKHKRQPEIAKKYLDTIKLNASFLNNPIGETVYWDVLSELKMSEDKYEEAIPFLEKKQERFSKMNDLQAQVDVEECLYKSKKKINRLGEATEHLERFTLLKDSLYNLRRSNSIIYYKTLYETEKRDSKIAIQEANINMLESKDRAKKNLLIFGGVGMSLLFLSIYLYRNRILLVRNKKLQQSFLQELLQTQERVSKRISKDLHDSVGQSLLLIKNKVLQNQDKQTANVVDDVINEVREISRTLHPFKLGELGLTVTLQSSVEMIDENYDIFISAEIDDIDTIFDPEKEINIYRLVQESFNNILKHSNARSAEIKVVNKDQNVEIIIKDNGKGFDVSKEKISASKIGLKTLAERSKFLKASFRILSEIDQGTTLIFNIPKHA